MFWDNLRTRWNPDLVYKILCTAIAQAGQGGQPTVLFNLHTYLCLSLCNVSSRPMSALAVVPDTSRYCITSSLRRCYKEYR